MDFVNREVPVEVLVDIKVEEKFLNSNTNSKLSIKPTTNLKEMETKIQPLSNKEIALSSKSCPIAILVDVSPPTKFSFREICASSTSVSAECSKDEPAGYKIPNAESHGFLDSKEKLDRNLNYADICNTEDSLNSSNSSEVQVQMPMKRLRWKTPSPQSMSRISKEASKVIDQLNSSIFNEDLLLIDEMLPIALNFDELDDTDEKNSVDNVFEDTVLNEDIVIGQQMLGEIEKKKNKLSNCSSKSVASNKFQDNLKHDHVQKNVNKSSFTFSNKTTLNSSKSCSSGIHSSSLSNSDSVTFCDEVDVFNMANIASEDKENLQNKKNKENVGNKTVVKISSSNKSKLDQRGRLRNLANIKTETSVIKSVTTPLKRMSISTSNKATSTGTEKPQAKKTALSVDSQYSMKGLYQSRSNAVSNVQKLQTVTKMDSGCSSLSSDLKQQNVLATPSRRYSICTPLKSASAMKPHLTPSVNSSHTFAFPRYTPQPIKPSRLSFSRSWQQSGGNSHLFPKKGFKQQISTTISSSSSKSEFGIKNSAKPVKLSFSQSMSAVSTGSLGKNVSSKGRFSNKLPSPLAIDKKVARALFTNVSVK